MARQLLNIHGVAIADQKISALRDSLAGHAISPSDPSYDVARRIWNASVDKYPGLIVRCANADDVVKAVNFGRLNDILVAVRGGGHNVGGRALCDDGLVIDLSQMRKVHVDLQARVVRAQAGCLLADVDRATHAVGLAVPLGIISQTGIAGLTLGGGVGWLVRKYGFTCDNVLSMEVVTADGRMRTASASENEDLFWGLRGGSGNFGVVVNFEYQAYPVDTVLGGRLIYGRDRTHDVLRFYRDFVASAPEEVTIYAILVHSADGDPITVLVPCWCGALDEGERVLKPLREFGPPVLDEVRPMPFPEMQSLFDDGYPDGNYYYWKSTFLKELDDQSIDVIIEHSKSVPSKLTSVAMEFYGGAGSRVSPTETAFGQRQPAYDVGLFAQWTDPAEASRNIVWTKAIFDALRPHASGAFLLNMLDREDEAVIRASFGPNYQRLAELKRKYDPDNFFRLNYNIKPARPVG